MELFDLSKSVLTEKETEEIFNSEPQNDTIKGQFDNATDSDELGITKTQVADWNSKFASLKKRPALSH